MRLIVHQRFLSDFWTVLCSFFKGLIGIVRGDEQAININEHCVFCREDLGYSASHEVGAFIRMKDGAMYADGVGQVCANCARRGDMPKPEDRLWRD